LLGDLKQDRTLHLLLHNDRAGRDPATLDDIADAEPNQIATTQLAVDRKVEQRDLGGPANHLPPNPRNRDLRDRILDTALVAATCRFGRLII
jgi:hypothetical protein